MATRIVKAEFTRPSDTTAYAVGDVISNSTSAGAAMLFTGALGGGRGQGSLRRVFITKSTNVNATSGMNLALFTSDPGVVNDNAAFANFFTNRDIISASVVVGTYIITGGATFSEFLPTGMGVPLVGGPTTGDLYGVLTAAQAYVPGSAEQFSVKLFIETA